MMDNGFPLTTEPNILKELVAQPNMVSKMLNIMTGKSSTIGNKLPDATASFVPWRTTLVKDASNEVYVNIVEELDACVNRYVFISPFLYSGYNKFISSDL
jgi:AP-3 complex subunit mu